MIDETLSSRKVTNIQKIVDKIPHSTQLKIVQDKPHNNPRVNSGATEGWQKYCYSH